MTEHGPSSTVSPQGRRVLVAVVTGTAGDRIQAWRQEHDPREAARIPPHTTLCYWANELDAEPLSAQVRHAFPAPIRMSLGPVDEFESDQGTFYVPLLETLELDEARRRLYDGTHLDMGPPREWTWHITCVRDATGRDLACLRAAAKRLETGGTWLLDRIACLELQGDCYEPVAVWDLGQ